MFTVALLIALLPVVGVYGAAIASAVAYGVSFTMMLMSLRRIAGARSGGEHRLGCGGRGDDRRPPGRSDRDRPHLPGGRAPHRRPGGPVRPVARPPGLPERPGRQRRVRPAAMDTEVLIAWTADRRGRRRRERGPVVGNRCWPQRRAPAWTATCGCTPSSRIPMPSVLWPGPLTARQPASADDALSDRHGTSAFHVVAPAAGTNSLYPVPGAGPGGAQRGHDHAGPVRRAGRGGPFRTGQDRCRGPRPSRAARGAESVRRAPHHGCPVRVQPPLDPRPFLPARCIRIRCAPLGYRIGKLTPRGVEFYPGWDADLETFVEGNYVACDPEAAAGLPAVPWWKSE